MHQWILQGNGEITLELERGWVSLSAKEIVLNRKESPKVELLEFLLRKEQRGADFWFKICIYRGVVLKKTS